MRSPSELVKRVVLILCAVLGGAGCDRVVRVGETLILGGRDSACSPERSRRGQAVSARVVQFQGAGELIFVPPQPVPLMARCA